MDWVEIAGFATGALCVWLLVIRNIWNFPVGMANNVLFLFLFAKSGLYADAGLQIVFFMIAAAGWFWWLRGGEQNAGVEISDPKPWQLAACIAAIGIITAGIHFILHNYTDSTVAGWDALTTAMSLVAQFMLGRKWIANWWLWIAVDLIYMPLYVSKGLWLTAILYGVFLIMCIAGLIQWREARKTGAS